MLASGRSAGRLSRSGSAGLAVGIRWYAAACGCSQRCAGRDLHDLRSESLTVNRGKVTDSRQRSNVRDFLLCPGVLHLISYPLQPIGHEADGVLNEWISFVYSYLLRNPSTYANFNYLI